MVGDERITVLVVFSPGIATSTNYTIKKAVYRWVFLQTYKSDHRYHNLLAETKIVCVFTHRSYRCIIHIEHRKISSRRHRACQEPKSRYLNRSHLKHKLKTEFGKKQVGLQSCIILFSRIFFKESNTGIKNLSFNIEEKLDFVFLLCSIDLKNEENL